MLPISATATPSPPWLCWFRLTNVYMHTVSKIISTTKTPRAIATIMPALKGAASALNGVEVLVGVIEEDACVFVVVLITLELVLVSKLVIKRVGMEKIVVDTVVVET